MPAEGPPPSGTLVTCNGINVAFERAEVQLASDLGVPAALHIAEEEGGHTARPAGSLLGLWRARRRC